MCLYISDKVKYKLRSDLNHANSNFETCFVEIEGKNKNLVVGVVYRSHTLIDHFVRDIEPIFKKLASEKNNFYILGDFNINLLKSETHGPTHEYLELIYSLSMLPTIYKPTRITETTATIIDNILTNDEEIIRSNVIVTDISDHLPTTLSTNVLVKNERSCKKKYMYKRNHNSANINTFKQKLSNVKWNEHLDGIDVNNDYDTFTDTFSSLYDECIPLKKVL